MFYAIAARDGVIACSHCRKDGKSLLALAAAVEAAEQKENGESVLEDVLKEISDKSVGSSCIQEALKRLERIGCGAFASEESIAEVRCH